MEIIIKHERIVRLENSFRESKPMSWMLKRLYSQEHHWPPKQEGELHVAGPSPPCLAREYVRGLGDIDGRTRFPTIRGVRMYKTGGSGSCLAQIENWKFWQDVMP
jgi:hypothetical protein